MVSVSLSLEKSDVGTISRLWRNRTHAGAATACGVIPYVRLRFALIVRCLQAPPHFLLNRAKRVLYFSLFQFWVDVLNVFDCGEIIAAFSVLWWFERFNEKSFQRRNKRRKRSIECRLPKAALLGYIK